MKERSRTGSNSTSSVSSGSTVRTDTGITAVFVVVALVSVAGTTTVTDSQQVHVAVLLGVGAIAPTLISEWRSESDFVPGTRYFSAL